MAAHQIDPLVSRRHALRLGSGSVAAAIGATAWRPAGAQDQPTLATNKALVQRVFTESIMAGNLAIRDELYAPDAVDRGTWARHMPGPAGMPVSLDVFHALVPEVTVTVDLLIAEGDLVATYVTWRAPHPPTGTFALGRTMHGFRVTQGQIVEEWSTGWEWLEQRAAAARARSTNPLAEA